MCSAHDHLSKENGLRGEKEMGQSSEGRKEMIQLGIRLL